MLYLNKRHANSPNRVLVSLIIIKYYFNIEQIYYFKKSQIYNISIAYFKQ